MGTPQTEGSIGGCALEPPHEAQKLEGHRGPVQSCAWGPGGKFLISAGTQDGTVRLWDDLPAAPRAGGGGPAGAVTAVARAEDIACG